MRVQRPKEKKSTSTHAQLNWAMTSSMKVLQKYKVQFFSASPWRPTRGPERWILVQTTQKSPSSRRTEAQCECGWMGGEATCKPASFFFYYLTSYQLWHGPFWALQRTEASQEAWWLSHCRCPYWWSVWYSPCSCSLCFFFPIQRRLLSIRDLLSWLQRKGKGEMDGWMDDAVNYVLYISPGTRWWGRWNGWTR